MSCTPLPKAAKPVLAKQLTQLPCLVVYTKFQFVYSCASFRIGVRFAIHFQACFSLLEGNGGINAAHAKVDEI